jgi:hypothetical protein
MNNAPYHRRQAELCLRIAELMSDPVAVKRMREAAARHFAEATKFEKPDGSNRDGMD